MNKILNSISYFSDPSTGRPASGGTIYVGDPDTDPTVEANQKTVYALQENGSQVAISQPISLSPGGNPTYNGSAVSLYVDGDYSITVFNFVGSQLQYVPSNVVITDTTKVQFFENTDDLVAATLVEGVLYNTQGYYDPHDGGHGEYLIMSLVDFGGTPDEYIDFSVNGGSSVAALQIKDNSISLNQAGAGYGTTDDTDRIQAVCDKGINTITGVGTFLMGSSVFVPVGVTISLDGRDSAFVPDVGSSFTQDHMFIFNSTDGLTPTVAFPNIPAGGMRNATFNNQTNEIADVRGCISFGPYEFSDLRGRWMYGMLTRATGYYSDNYRASRIYSEPALGTGYQIDILGLGDSLIVEECHMPYNALNGTVDFVPNGIRLATPLGGVIRDCIGGNIAIQGGAEVTIDRGHFERTQFLITESNVNIKDTYIAPNSETPIILADNSSHSFQLNLENVVFAYLEGAFVYDGFDVRIDNRYTVKVSNCYRRFLFEDSLSRSQLMGIRMGDSSNTSIDNWNNFSYILSRSGIIFQNYMVNLDFNFREIDSAFPGITGATTSVIEWGGASDTYYYTAQIFTDINRLIGRSQTGAEVSVAVTNGGDGVRLSVDYGSKNWSGILKIYRGTTTGSYDEYVYIPIVSLNALYDNGTEINGFTWQSRVAGAVTTLNSMGADNVTYKGTYVDIMAATVPTVGTFSTSDKIYDTTPSASGTIGWVCTAGGTPGTWKSWGTISA